MGRPNTEGRTGSAPGFTVDLGISSPPAPAPRRWPWLLVPLVALGGAGGAFVWRAVRSAETFALTLELKTADGQRSLRIAGGEATLDEQPRKGKPIVTSCVFGTRDTLALQSLARSKLLDAQGHGPGIGTFMTTVGGEGEVTNGVIDAETAALFSDFILKRTTACVPRP